jgi:hypothetical protein
LDVIILKKIMKREDITVVATFINKPIDTVYKIKT